MTPKRDHEEDMSMEEILASIRKFVTDNPPEDPHHQQRVYKGDLRESVVIPPAGHDEPAKKTGGHSHRSRPIPERPQPGEGDVLDLKKPVFSSSPLTEEGTPAGLARGQFRDAQDDSIMTLTNPISGSKTEKTQHSSSNSTAVRTEEEGVGSSHAVAASASSFARLAQTAKAVPSKSTTLADQRNVTLDQLIQDMIRPMIKQWIDAHLPALVEEMVAKEIKRITKHLE